MPDRYKDLNKRRATSQRFYERNKVRIRQQRNNKYEEQEWPRHLMKKYGMTIEQYNKLLESQGGLCAITGLPPKPGEKLAVDHDHKTGKVRGLIRKEINKAIGAFQDNPEWLKKAADYVEGSV